MFKSLSILFLLFIFSWSLSAQEWTEFSAKELQEIKQQLSLSSAIYQVALSASEKSQIPLSESSWIKELEESSVQLLRASYVMPEQEKFVSRFRSLIKWKNLWKQVKDLSPKIKNYTRLNGFGLAFAVVATSPSEIVGPIIVTAMGRPDLIPLVIAFPTTGVAVGGQVAAQRFLIKRELIKSMGSKEIYQAFIETGKEHRKLLKMTSVHDYLHKFNEVDGELEILTIQKENYLTKVKEAMGIKKTNITYSKVMEFCERRNLIEDDFFVKGISERIDLPKEYKAGLILEHLRKFGDEELVSDIYEWFEDGIVKMKLTSEMEEVYKAAKELSRAETLAELRAKVLNLPKDIDAKMLAEVWRNRILRDLTIANQDLNHFEFRRLVNRFTALYGKIQAQEGTVTMNAETKNSWLKYLDNISTTKLTCSDQYSPI